MALVIAYLDEEVEFSGIVGGPDDLLWRKAASKSCNFVILVSIIISYQCWGSVTFRCGSGSSDPYLPLTNGSGSGSGSNSGSDSVLHWYFKDAKKFIFFP
jgi:hypothetical protein